MQGYIVSFQNNLLKVSLAGSDLHSKKKVKGSITDTALITEELGQLLLDEFGPDPTKLPLNFLISPADIRLNFLTIDKNAGGVELYDLAREKLVSKGLNIESFYFSYQKIAPFVYQLVAIKKEILDAYLQIVNEMGFELRSIVPWVLLLPKYISKSGEPAIFVLDNGEHKYLALSELGGIYHLGPLDQTKVSGELEELIQKLSVYQRNTPITNIYTFNIPDLKLSKKYNVKVIGFEDVHTLVENEVTDEALLNSQVNLLNLLPRPEPEKRISPLMYVGGVAAAALLVLGILWLAKVNGESVDQLTQETTETTSATITEVTESTESTVSVPVEEEQAEETTPVELNRAYLRIRVENGTNVGGLAGRTRDHLVEAGYEVVSIGDADESDHVTTVISFTPANAIYKDLLVSDLDELFGDIEVQENLNEELGYDVLIIAGSDDGQ